METDVGLEVWQQTLFGTGEAEDRLPHLYSCLNRDLQGAARLLLVHREKLQ